MTIAKMAMPPEAMPPRMEPTPAHSSRGTVTRRTPCIQCRYDLVGLPCAGNCPECGTPIEATTLAERLRAAEEFHRQTTLASRRSCTIGCAGTLLGAAIVAMMIGILARLFE